MTERRLWLLSWSWFTEELTGLFRAGGGGAAELGVYPGQSDLPQEITRPGGGKHAGEEATALAVYLML